MPVKLPASDPLPAELATRHSNGLDQFFSSIKGGTGLSILDLAGANQANVTFITSLAHRLYSEDLLRSLPSETEDTDRVQAFLRQNLAYPERHFDGVLVWDVLEYLEAPLLTATVERLFRIVKPGACLLSVFHSADRTDSAPQRSFRIQDAKTLQLAPRPHRALVQTFNNRSLEKLFQRFESLKFFLTRDNLREVIVKR